jgi:hypothetical protein
MSDLAEMLAKHQPEMFVVKRTKGGMVVNGKRCQECGVVFECGVKPLIAEHAEHLADVALSWVADQAQATASPTSCRSGSTPSATRTGPLRRPPARSRLLS